MANIPSLQAKLLNVARSSELQFQLLLNRYGAEQFLARLSESSFVDKFIFKGGSLLAYLIETERKTKDLDFTISQLSNEVENVVRVIKEVLSIELDDGLTWGEVEGSLLKHPDMEFSGVRIFSHFLLGKMRGKIQMDLALGEVAEAIKIPLRRIRYKDQPLIGPDFLILSYPKELIFAEKLQIAVSKGEDNTRMRDYYDMFKLSQNVLNPTLFRICLNSVFEKRNFKAIRALAFSEQEVLKLQTYWEGYIRKALLQDAPRNIQDVIFLVNEKLGTMLIDE